MDGQGPKTTGVDSWNRSGDALRFSTGEERLRGVMGGSDEMPRLQPGTRVDTRFELRGRLGVGGMGVVYLALDCELEREVALKFHRQGGSAGAERFLREARAMARVAHPGVATIHHTGRHAGVAYLAMEYMAGGDLRGWLAERRGSPKEALALLLQAGRGLAAAHGVGLVHRDFKPGNVLLSGRGDAVVADFGLAFEATSELSTHEGGTAPAGETLSTRAKVAGTPAYMAPEQAAGEGADARSDQFSFAVAVYEALSFTRPDAQGLSDARPERLVRDASKEVDQAMLIRLSPALARALSRDPLARFDDMPALVRALEDASAAAGRWRSLRPAVAFGASVAAALALGSLGLALGPVGEGAEGQGMLEQGQRLAAAGAVPASTWTDPSLGAVVKRVRSLRGERDFEAALHALGASIARSDLSDGDRACLLLEKGLIHSRAEALADALGVFVEATRLAEVGGREPCMIDALIESAQARLDLGWGARSAIDEARRAEQLSRGGEARQRVMAGVVLGRAQLELGEIELGLQTQSDALAAAELELPSKHPAWASAFDYTAASLLAAGRQADALEFKRKAIANVESRVGPRHPDLIVFLRTQARAELAAGERLAAIASLRRAHALASEHMGRDNLHTHTLAFDLGVALSAHGEIEAAQAGLREGLRAPSNRSALHRRVVLAEIYLDYDRPVRARALLAEVLGSAQLGEHPRAHVRARRVAGLAALRQSPPDQGSARAHFSAARAILGRVRDRQASVRLALAEGQAGLAAGETLRTRLADYWKGGEGLPADLVARVTTGLALEASDLESGAELRREAQLRIARAWGPSHPLRRRLEAALKLLPSGE